ncbi:MAG: SAM-dependent methyltransferase [Clostridium sp.]|nr:SAM-dependent methyltransferase [Clostridium sp.]
MKLKGRLRVVADMVPKCDIVYDIGTDHAYVPIYLIQEGRCKRSVASDVREGPLKVATQNILEYGFEEKITKRTGFGLDTIGSDETGVIIIAGMGGLTITQILGKGLETAKRFNAIIIQPMNSIELVRKWLYENGFAIYSERLSKEGNRIYSTLAAKWTGRIQSKKEIYYYVGEKLIESQDRLLEKYILKKLEQKDKILAQMEKKNEDYDNLKSRYKRIRDGFDELLKTINQRV